MQEKDKQPNMKTLENLYELIEKSKTESVSVDRLTDGLLEIIKFIKLYDEKFRFLEENT